MQNTPAGNVWLIFCLYSLSVDQRPEQGIYATITQMERGEVETLSLSEEHRNILSEREKEILRCIRKGLSSKEIAATLYISVNTVNRHRQNILGKTFCRQLDRSLSGSGADEIAVIFLEFIRDLSR